MRRTGFTMLEVLVAVTILAMIAAIVYASFVSVINTSEVARQAAADLRFQTHIQKSFQENMSSIYTDPPCLQPSYALIGEDDGGGAGSGDTLTFCTSLPMAGATALPGVLRKVRYELVPESDAAEGRMDVLAIDTGIRSPAARMMLQVTETPLVNRGEEEDLDLGEADSEEQTRIRQVPVSSMNIQYYDGVEESWVDEWDSVELGRMPWAIHVKVNLARTEEQLQALYGQGIDLQENPDIDLMFPLPVGSGVVTQFPDMNHMPSWAGEEADGSSMFNESL